jgi:asparagine synthase (glutamine-hydrolysing)
MCGILFGLGNPETIGTVINHAQKLNFRGPDATITGGINGGHAQWMFHRLAIQGMMRETKFIEQGDYLLLCNGEVYLPEEYRNIYSQETIELSDCEWILKEYIAHIDNDPMGHVQRLLVNSEYAFVLFNKRTGIGMAYRDQFGIRPLFYACTTDGSIFYSSEMKYLQPILHNEMTIVEQVPLGIPVGDIHVAGRPLGSPINGLIVAPSCGLLDRDEFLITGLHDALFDAIRDRIHFSDAPISYFLSGGMDSSIVCAMAQRISNKPINTFSIGMNEYATDPIAAKIAADFIGTNHKTVIVPPSEFLAAIDQCIYFSETWDVTTIRAGIGMFLLSKWIKKNHSTTKVILTGEGSDELFGSYRYFLNAPNAEAHKEETKRLLKDLCYFDVLRCDRTISNNGLEARVPFLDSRVVSFVHKNYTPEDYLPRNGLMKWHLRKVAEKYALLPKDIYHRPKEAFSDGVSTETTSWHDVLQLHFAAYVPKNKAPFVTTNEMGYYYDTFLYYYPHRTSVIPYQWLPKWCGDEKDPSARNLKLREKLIIVD